MIKTRKMTAPKILKKKKKIPGRTPKTNNKDPKKPWGTRRARRTRFQTSLAPAPKKEEKAIHKRKGM